MTLETQAELVHTLRRMTETLDLIATTINTQNELIEKQIETGQRTLAVLIINAKVNAKVGVVINALSVTDHKEVIELLDKI